MKKILTFVVVALLGLTVGFLIGVRVGTYEHQLADAQYKASVLAFQLQALKAGKNAPVLTSMEISLSAELANHGRYMDSHLTWLWPELVPADDRAIRHAVAYRLANPYELPDHSSSGNWIQGMDMESQFVKDTIEGQRALKHHLDKVLRHYGTATHSSAPER